MVLPLTGRALYH